MRTWMKQVAALRLSGIEVIWVTSGAIAWAVQQTKFNRRTKSLPEKQALSAIGQPLVMDNYNMALQANGLSGAQVLLTAEDMTNKKRRRNLQNTLAQLLKWKLIPILNENDAVSTEEIQFGDNDSLSAQIAEMMKAERLILLTDVDGLFDDDPKKNPDAQMISYLAKIGSKELRVAQKKSSSSVGTGGMRSKLLAAASASKNGIVAHMVRGDHPNNLLEIAAGHEIGTQVGGRK